jgi:trigger factor
MAQTDKYLLRACGARAAKSCSLSFTACSLTTACTSPLALKTTVTELSDSRVRLDAEVPSDELESRVQRTATQLGRDLRIPGFRKGKVPGPMVIQRIGRDAVLEQAVRDSLPEWYEEAIVRSGISTVGDPQLNLDQLPSTGEPLNFSIEVGVTPTASLGKYRELEVGKRSPEVPDEAVQTELDRLRESFARLDSVDREAREGDHLVLDFVGRVDGEEFKGGEARDYMLEIGGGRLIEGFEEQLVGARAGEERSVEIDFPDEYPAEELQGRHAVFDVRVKDVKEKQLPDLDDDFASEASEFDTVQELRDDIHHKLEHAQEHAIEDEFRQAAVDAAVAEAKVDLPDELVTARAEEMWERTERVLGAQGVDPASYLAASGKTKEEMVEEAKDDARRTLSRESVLEAVAEAEGIEVSDEDLLEALEPTAEREGTSPDKLLSSLAETGRDAPIRRELRLRRAVDTIAESAQAIEPGTAKARDAIWTPEKQAKEEGSAQLWTPGSGDAPAKPR